MSNERVCLTPGCGKVIRARGLCQACYSAARLRVNSVPSITWDTLSDVGLALPKKGEAATGEEGATFAAVFDAAMQEQEDQKSLDANLQEALAVKIAAPPKRAIDTRPTVADIRRAAEAVAANPSAENLERLSVLMGQIVPAQPKPVPAELPDSESQPNLENVPSSVPEVDPDDMPDLAPGMAWERKPGGYHARAMTREELIIAERKKAIANNRELRQRSFTAAREEGTKESEIDSGDPEGTGMSDAEFERIKRAHLIRTGKMPKPPPPVVVAPLIQKPPPTFPEPELPSDVPYNQTLDSGGDAEEAAKFAATAFVPINPITVKQP